MPDEPLCFCGCGKTEWSAIRSLMTTFDMTEASARDMYEKAALNVTKLVRSVGKGLHG